MKLIYLNILGLKNSKILFILSFFTFLLGILIILIFYNFSSNFKNIYLEIKKNYTSDDKYLAVINKNGYGLKIKLMKKINIINSSKIDNNYLIE